MNENSFEQDGKTFVAVDSATCLGCYFDCNGCVYVEHPCDAGRRDDDRHIRWKEKI